MLAQSVRAGENVQESSPSAIGAALAHAKHPGILLGSDLLDGPAFAAGAALAAALRAAGVTPRLGYVFATACVVYLFGKKPWIDWLEVGFWLAYMALFGALHWEQKNVCTSDGPEDHLAT